jgi:hypothetical protein
MKPILKKSLKRNQVSTVTNPTIFELANLDDSKMGNKVNSPMDRSDLIETDPMKITKRPLNL